MKPNRARSKNSAVVTNSRWLAYAMAGAASSFISANSAEATIHYSGIIKERFVGDAGARFPLDQPDHQIRFSHIRNQTATSSFDGGSAHFAISALGGSFAGFYACAYNSSVASVSNLERGDAISTRPFVPQNFFYGILESARGQSCGGGDRGQFRGDGIGFVGFKFNGGGGDQYGWARIEMHGANNRFQLIDYAYGDIGDRIRAGQKAGGHAPELESLGGLALGATGLLAWRRRHSKKSVTSSI